MARSLLGWALPGLFFTIGFGFAACLGGSDPGDECDPSAVPAGSGGTGGTGGSGSTAAGTGGEGATDPGNPETSQNDDNNFHHPMDPTQSGQDDPFEILKQRAAEGPPEVRTRLHSCSKLTYAALGDLLVSRGVDLNKTGTPPTAGKLYKASSTKDALGVANFDARMGESYFYTISSATKILDIFVRAAPEIIQNLPTMPDCMQNGAPAQMFDPVSGKCVYNGLSCIMGRPASEDDMDICNLMIQQANPADPKDVQTKRELTVAAFLSAAHTCQ